MCSGEACSALQASKLSSENRKAMISGLRKFGLALAVAASCGVAASAADFAILRNGFSIRHERREAVDTMTRLYLDTNPTNFVDVPTSEIDHFEIDPTPAPPAPNVAKVLDLDGAINAASDRHHLDADLINSVIHAESGFNPRAVSRKGAQGLMQLMPQTASKLGVENPFDPATNIEGGTRYLRELLERYNFDLVKALAAYNAGPQRVEQYHGVPPYYETRAYVARIIREFNQKKLSEEKATAQTASAARPHAAQARRASLPKPATPSSAGLNKE
jgi:soluble lytic murein transglycosylase-like protein